MRKYVLIFIPIILLIPVNNGFCQDTIYPSGSNINCTYSLSGNQFRLDDTLTIIREVTNDESFTLMGLYFSETLPPEFEIISTGVTINSLNINHRYIESAIGEIVDGYSTHYFVLDDPDSQSVYNNVLNPGNTARIVLKVISSQSGDYQFPIHSAVMYSATSNFFTIADAVNVSVQYLCGDVNRDNSADIGDIVFLINCVFKFGPLPDPITDGDLNCDGRCNVGDAVFMINYVFKDGPDLCCGG
ncbi:MAG: dockerin type I domain-containing protein [candidate division Zixibacteria bacterium]